MKERGTDVDGTDGECTRGEVSMLRMRCVRIGCDARLYVDGRVEMLCEDRRMETMHVGSKGAEVFWDIEKELRVSSRLWISAGRRLKMERPFSYGCRSIFLKSKEESNS